MARHVFGSLLWESLSFRWYATYRKKTFSAIILGMNPSLVVTKPARGAGVQMCQEMWRKRQHILASIEKTDAKRLICKSKKCSCDVAPRYGLLIHSLLSL